MKTNKRYLLKLVSIVIYTIVIFCIGYSYGNVKSSYKNLQKELDATKAMLEAQGDSPRSIEKTLEVIKIDRLKEIGGAKRQLFSIWLPSMLVIINIFVTIYTNRLKE
jgi:hypothetical protein